MHDIAGIEAGQQTQFVAVSQVGAGPSKSAKKKAKKKAAAARKADVAENGGTEGLEAAGTNSEATANGQENGHAHVNGAEHVDTNGVANKKKKSKGTVAAAACMHSISTDHAMLKPPCLDMMT